MLIAPIWLKIRTSNFRNTFPGQTVKEFRWQVQPFCYNTHVWRTYGLRNCRGIYALQHRPTVASKKSNAINFKKPPGTPGGCLRLPVYGRLSLVLCYTILEEGIDLCQITLSRHLLRLTDQTLIWCHLSIMMSHLPTLVSVALNSLCGNIFVDVAHNRGQNNVFFC